MKTEGPAQRATIFIGSSDTWHGRNLAVAVIERCKALGIAGATATRGIMGFGKHSVIHKAHLLRQSNDLPAKIEVVDQPEQIERLLQAVEPMMGGGIIIVEDVHATRYMRDPKGPKAKTS